MSTKFKWKAILGLITAWVAIVYDLTWVWGVIFLIWVIPELKYGTAHFIEFVEKRQNPILYWAIIISWIVLSLYLIITPLVPQLNPESEEFIGYKRTINYKTASGGDYRDEHEPDSAPKLILLNNVSRNNTQKKEVAKQAQLKEMKQKSKESKEENKDKRDPLFFRNFAAPSFNLLGISVETTFENDQHEKDIKKVWEELIDLNFHKIVPGNKGTEIYAVYSNYHGPAKSSFTYTVGLRLDKKIVTNNKMKMMTVPKTNFAVFDTKYKNGNSINNTWQKIYESDLERAFTYDVELYKLDMGSYAIKDVEIWASTKN